MKEEVLVGTGEVNDNVAISWFDAGHGHTAVNVITILDNVTTETSQCRILLRDFIDLEKDEVVTAAELITKVLL
jgi:hypothetical protein